METPGGGKLSPVGLRILVPYSFSRSSWGIKDVLWEGTVILCVFRRGKEEW